MPQTQRHPSPAMQLTADEVALRDAITSKLTYVRGRNPDTATANDWYQATALAVRDRLTDIWMAARRETKPQKKKRV
jgi:starch phosphorylase